MMKFTALVVVLLLINQASADMYLHGPRGSDNRLNENNQNRNNADRLFDSQNNDRGGYNVGDITENQGDGKMVYYSGSQLLVEWTNQHGANNPNLNTDISMQYLCNVQENGQLYNPTLNGGVRDGTATTDLDTNAPATADRGKHEPVANYNDCNARERNKGLFLADQDGNLDANNENTAVFTRQNTNGNRHGFECAEEREYYPYWHPSPWIDIAMATSDISRCEYYTTNSQNIAPRYYCSNRAENNKIACEAGGDTWQTQSPVMPNQPLECVELGWARDNHLGNSVGGQPLSYNWTIPTMTSGTAENCVFRIRYNVSTKDYIGWGPTKMTALNNGDESPIADNPTVNFGSKDPPQAVSVKLALNTDQYGRTFQDRSHVFEIAPRPAAIPATARIFNLNVRGRRGNIVQTYPSVEYDFQPNRLHITTADFVHIQWTGSQNTPDGAGEGTASTDKSNIVQMAGPGMNYPLPFDNAGSNMFPTLALKTDMATAGAGTGAGTQLNGANSYYNAAPMQFAAGEYHYMCTRNNNFTNRSQKGAIFVV